jgi:hypothetical protein
MELFGFTFLPTWEYKHELRMAAFEAEIRTWKEVHRTLDLRDAALAVSRKEGTAHD